MKLKRLITIIIVVLLIISSVQLTSAVTYQKGDVNIDKAINIEDATMIQRVLSGMAVNRYYQQYADFDRSGTIDVVDATSIQRYAAGQIMIYSDYMLSYTNNNKLTVVRYFGNDTDITVPGYLYGYNYFVTTIGSEAFYNNSTIKTVTLPSAVSQIENYAFSNCKNLTTIYSYNKNLKWGNAFLNCPKFQAIKFK